MTLLRICVALSAVSAFALTSAVAYKRSRRQTPEQLERLRRLNISARGRLTDGTVLEVRHEDGGDRSARQVVVYSYDVSGVEYHCAQDLTALSSLLDLRDCCLGDTTSVKYDPRSPGDSIVAAEGWCGLRKVSQPTANSPVRAPLMSSPETA
jgi:uncharacterized protein DUF3592